MDIEITLTVIGTFLYCVATLLAVLSLTSSQRTRNKEIVLLTVPGAILLATALAIHGLRTGQIPAFGRFEAITCYSLAITAAYLHMAIAHQTKGISAILLTFVTIMLLIAAPAVKTNTTLMPEIQSIWLGMHVLAAFIGYGFFTVASVLAIGYLIQDSNLKKKRFGAMFESFPDLETLETLMYRQITFAFGVFSLSIILGIALTHINRWGKHWLTDPKIVATGITWLIYAFLFYLRMHADRHGRKVALVTVAGLFFVLFAFVGVHHFGESIHDFIMIQIPGK